MVGRGIEALKAFKTREGHCYVPAFHVKGRIHLGHWVTIQRRCRKKKKMDSERKRRLDKIGFVWNGRYTKAIKHRLAALRSKTPRANSPPKARVYAIGVAASGMSAKGHVRFWDKADMGLCAAHVCF